METQTSFSENQHAYILSGNPDDVIRHISLFLEKNFKATREGNPDYSHERYDVLGIDEARSLKETQGRRSFDGGNKFFVISAGSITREAQNALLKVFEEPTSGTFIFLILPTFRGILPTLRSRVRTLDLGRTARDMSQIKLFLKTPRGERLELPFIKKMVTDKERLAIVTFFEALEKYITEEGFSRKKEFQSFLRDFLATKKYIHDRAPSLKMLLEHVVLIAPTI